MAQTGINISNEAYRRLKKMAKADGRRPTTTEIEWLINQEWEHREAEKAIATMTKNALAAEENNHV